MKRLLYNVLLIYSQLTNIEIVVWFQIETSSQPDPAAIQQSHVSTNTVLLIVLATVVTALLICGMEHGPSKEDVRIREMGVWQKLLLFVACEKLKFADIEDRKFEVCGRPLYMAPYTPDVSQL